MALVLGLFSVTAGKSAENTPILHDRDGSGERYFCVFGPFSTPGAPTAGGGGAFGGGGSGHYRAFLRRGADPCAGRRPEVQGPPGAVFPVGGETDHNPRFGDRFTSPVP
jgi:hypothetical protein